MPIKLIQVQRKLNVGINTVVEFLRKKGFEVEDNNPNTRIGDEQYALLVKEFGKDLPNGGRERERVVPERPHREASSVKEEKNSEIKTVIPDEFKPKIVTKGRIDLDRPHKKVQEGQHQPVSAPVEKKVEKPMEVASAEKTAEAEKNKILDNGKKQSDMKYQQIISEAKMNARRAELGAKEEVIEAAFAKATEDLKAKASSDDAEYSESLIKMIEEATEELGGGDLIVQVKESDVAKVEGHLKKLSADLATKTGVSTTLVLGEPIDAIGGAILKTRNGDIEVNNTIESRLDRFKGLLRSEVANVLFKN